MEHRLDLLDPFFEGLTYVGSFGVVWLALSLVLSRFSWRRPWLPGRVAATVLLGESLQATLKLAVRRDRPPLAEPDPEPIVELPSTYSFPSGHATVAFACATILAFAVPRLTWPFYGLAALVAASRVYVGVHYPGDVAAGAVLGLVLGLLVELARRRLRAYVRAPEAARALPKPPADRRRSPPGPPPG